MTYKCYVPLCDSGTIRANRRYYEEKKPRPALFKVTEARLKMWKLLVPQRGDKGNLKLRVGHHICSRHFDEKEIIRSYNLTLKDGTLYTAPRSPAELVKGACPYIFDYPEEYLIKPVEKIKDAKTTSSITKKK